MKSINDDNFDYKTIIKNNEIDYWIGNPSVELISGTVYFRKNSESDEIYDSSTDINLIFTQLKKRFILSNVLLVLPIPIQKNFFEFAEFIQEEEKEILEMRILKTSIPKAYGVLICFSGPIYADKFYKKYLGKHYINFEDDICLIKEVINIKLIYERTKRNLLLLKKNTIKSQSPLLKEKFNENEKIDPLALFVLNLNEFYSENKKNKRKNNELLTEEDSPHCPICFEELENLLIIRDKKLLNKTKFEKNEPMAVLGILCGHFFHTKCLKKWNDSTCPLCRYHQQPPETSYCEVCGSSSDLWMCLICGFIGCGLENKADSHNVEHYKKTQHIYCIEIESKLVYDHSKESFVHRLLQNSVDGKIMETGGLGKKGFHKKIENIVMEFNVVMSSQYDTQRLYYEEELKKITIEKDLIFNENSKKIKEISFSIENEINQKNILKNELKKNEDEHEIYKKEYEKILKEMSDINKENTILSKQLEKLNFEFSKKNNEKLEILNEEIENLQSQIKDVESNLQIKTKLGSQINESELASSQYMIYKKNPKKKK